VNVFQAATSQDKIKNNKTEDTVDGFKYFYRRHLCSQTITEKFVVV